MFLIKTLIWLVCLTPLGWMLYAGFANQLGPDPGKALVNDLGLWALRLLLITLALRPLRDITHKAVFIRVRRLVGLFCWFYASMHFTASLFYIIGFSWSAVLGAFSDKTYIILGLLAWLLLVPLGVTSNRWAQRRLGRRWVALHRAIYAVVVLACLHFIWLVREDYREPALYSVLSLMLLAWRVPAWRGWIIQRAPARKPVLSE